MKPTGLGCVVAGVLALVAGGAVARAVQPEPKSPAATGATPAGAHAVPFPHPLITEVLFNVPTGPKGDANGDGLRDAVGDEFVELINPHGKPIQLKGYVLTDSAGWPGATVANPDAAEQVPDAGAKSGDDASGTKRPASTKGSGANRPAAAPKAGEVRRGAVKFVFPSLVLQPGERVVVFNGYRQRFDGPVGGSGGAPAAKNPKFGDAYVFSMHNDSKYNSFSNAGDWVGLQSPRGEAVETLVWGVPKSLPPRAIVSEEVIPDAGGVQRGEIDGPFERHEDLPGDAAGKPCSPGVFSWTPPGVVPGVK